MSDFYKRLDEKEAQGRIERIFKDRPDDLHDYQGCANDPNMVYTPPAPPSAEDLDAVAAEQAAAAKATAQPATLKNQHH